MSAFTIIAVLCTLDILTTNHVISNSIGYESNEALAAVIGKEFYMFKYFTTLAIVAGIAHLCRKNRNLEITSYTTLISFYSIIVLNNMAVIFANTDLNLNLLKLFIIFGFMFILFNLLINAKKRKFRTQFRN
jgi:hypothetical protein